MDPTTEHTHFASTVDVIAPRNTDPGASTGQVITFYSYKGGTGRSMALANTAVLLAGRGESRRETLMIDWDLEAPGLHKYFPIRSDHRRMADPEKPGLADLFGVLFSAANKYSTLGEVERRAKIIELVSSIDIHEYIAGTDVSDLYLLKAGRFDSGYSDLVNRFRWDEFYDWAPWAFRALTERLIKKFRYVLVDSRTGITDTSSICTSLLPDKLVVVFTPNEQSLEGVRELVDRTIAHRHESDDLRPLIVYPLPSRIEESEPSERDAWRLGSESRGLVGWQPLFERTLAGAYEITECNLSEYFDQVQIRHHPFYAYGEKVAVRIDRGTEVTALPKIYERFVEWLADRASPWESAEAAAARRARAIGRRVDAVYLALESNEQRDAARRMFSRLVNLRGQYEVGDFSLRIAMMSDFAPEQTLIAPIIEHFAQQGLLRVERSKGGDDKVQLSDESLLAAWPRLREWIDADRAFLVWRQRLDHQLETWHDSGRDPSQLLRSSALQRAVGFWTDRPLDFNTAEREFVQLSQSEEATRGEATSGGVQTVSAPSLDYTAVFQVPGRSAGPGSPVTAPNSVAAPSPIAAPNPAAVPLPKSSRRVSVYLFAAGIVLVLAIGAIKTFGHSSSHADLVVAATRLSNDPAQAALLLASLDEKDGAVALARGKEIAANRLPIAVFPIPGAIASAAVNARGTYVVTTTADGSAFLRTVKADSGRLLKLPVTDALRGGFSPDGRALLVARKDGSLLVLADSVGDDSPTWTPGRLLSIVPTGAQTVSAALTSDRSLLAINRDGSFTLWSRQGCCSWTSKDVHGRGDAIRGAAFSADGSTFGVDGLKGFQLWSTRTPNAPILTRSVSPRLLTVSTSGNYVGVVTQDSTALVWDQIGPTIWQRRTMFATGLAVDRTGEHVALSSASGSTLVIPIRATSTDSIDLRTPGPVAALSFGAGSSLITASDSTLRVWDLNRPLPATDATWSDLRSYLASATSGCLSPQDRTTILGENNSAANNAYARCAERIGLRPLVVAAPGGRQNPPPADAKARPTATPVMSTPVAPDSPADTIDIRPLTDGRQKTWTGEWARAEGATSSIEFSLTLNGQRASGHVRWGAASGKQDQYGAARLSAGESDVSGTFDPRRLELQLRAEKSGPGDPAAYRLLIVDRRLQLRGTVSTADSVRTTVRATYSAAAAR
jgi:Mrp family chromosome partitioning ATPase